MRRPPAFYAHLLALETAPSESALFASTFASPVARGLLAAHGAALPSLLGEQTFLLGGGGGEGGGEGGGGGCCLGSTRGGGGVVPGMSLDVGLPSALSSQLKVLESDSETPAAAFPKNELDVNEQQVWG